MLGCLLTSCMIGVNHCHVLSPRFLSYKVRDLERRSPGRRWEPQKGHEMRNQKVHIHTPALITPFCVNLVGKKHHF